jgi:hypothetical protein
MGARDLGSDEQTQAQALQGAADRPAIKWLEQFCHRGGRDRFAGIGDAELEYMILGRRPHTNRAVGSSTRQHIT